MGAWTFIDARLRRYLPENLKLSHVARAESASPATGSATVHEQETQELLKDAFSF
jgi:2-oxoglutarate dehydrogenase E1 component